MKRVVKAYDERYEEFLDVAQSLFFSKGYERTSVKEIINAVGVAKGTFYHYFDAKVDLLEGLVARLMEQVYGQIQETMDTVLSDGAMTGVEKFEQLFVQIGNWKVEHPEYVRESVRIYYQDENVLFRDKMIAAATEKIAPVFSDVIRQGVEEGDFDVAHPEEAARLVFVLNQTFSEAVVRMMLAGERREVAIERMAPRLETYERSVERILGAKEGSLNLIEMAHVAVWFEDAVGAP